MPLDLFDAVTSGALIGAHNAEFEWVIWNVIGVGRLGWPMLKLSQLRCLAASAAAVALPRKLEHLAPIICPGTEKDMEGHRLMLRMTKPRKPSKSDPSEWAEKFDQLERLFEYCEQDTKTEIECAQLVPALPAREQAIWEFTCKINERGVYCDVPLVKRAQSFTLKYISDLSEELKHISGGAIYSANQRDKLLSELQKENVFMPDLRANTVTEALSSTKEYTPKARRMLEIRQALAKSSVKKLKSMLEMAGDDNRIRGTLLYHGASTGRYAGRGIQVHNYPRPIIKDVSTIFRALEVGDYEFFKAMYPDVLVAISSMLRGFLRSSPGHDLVAGDFNAIEARVVLWLAGDENLELFRQNKDSYKFMASDIYGVDWRDVTGDQRFVGKETVLGCGFGMGWRKFQMQLHQKAGLTMSADFCKRVIAAYRSRYGAVVDLWYGLEGAAISATKKPGKVIKYGHTQWLKRPQALYCRLPSGRVIAYWGAKVVKAETPRGIRDQLEYFGVDATTKKWRKERTYGGKIAENVTQAVARDVMVQAMLRLEEHGYMQVFTVHDEIVTEVPGSFGSLEEFTKIMQAPVAWAPDLPVKAEGYRAKRFKK